MGRRPAEGVFDESVVGGVGHRGVEVAVELQPARHMVDFTCFAVRGDFDDDVELHRVLLLLALSLGGDGTALTLTEQGLVPQAS